MDNVFQALANATRRRILDLVQNQPGSCVNDICHEFKMSRIGVMKHLGILESAGLLKSIKEGRKRLLYFNPIPIQIIHDRWTSAYSALWSSRITEFKYELESKELEPCQNKPDPYSVS